MTTRTRQTSTVGSGTALVAYDVHGDLADATPDRPVLLLVRRPASRATTPVFSAASSASRATRTPLPPPCEASSTGDAGVLSDTADVATGRLP